MRDDLQDKLARARSAVTSSRLLSLDELHAERAANANAETWGLSVLRGRLVELSACGANATMTAAIDLVYEAQLAGEPAAWIAETDRGFPYAVDVAAAGVDLQALVVVRCPDVLAIARSAERLLSSGAFGLIVLDIGPRWDELRPTVKNDLSTGQQGRLLRLAQEHDAAVVCLTEKSARARDLGSPVSLRVEARRIGEPGEFFAELVGLKDRRCGPGWTRRFPIKAPEGLERIRR